MHRVARRCSGRAGDRPAAERQNRRAGRMGKDRELDKAERARLRELASIAYERELARELAELEDGFRRWRAGEINAFGLSEAIHLFHQGPSRDLFSKYSPSNLEILISRM